MIVAAIAFVPLGTESTSLSGYIKKAIEAMQNTEVRVYPRAMFTEIEAESLEMLFSAIKAGEQALLDSGVKRFLIELKADIRLDAESSVEKKLRSIGFDDE